MVNFKNSSKSETQNFKNAKQYFVTSIEKKIREKFGKIQKWFEEGVAFWSFVLHMVLCYQKQKIKSWKIVNSKYKTPKQYFHEDREESSEKVSKDPKVIWKKNKKKTI